MFRRDEILKGIVGWCGWSGLVHVLILGVVLQGCSGGKHALPEVEPELSLENRMIKYQDMLRKDPESAEALYQMGNVYFDMGDFTEALEFYGAALERDPKHLAARANLGGVLQEMGELEGAIVEYRRVVDLSPKDARAHSNLGNALYENGQVGEAVDEFRRALELDPQNAHAHYNLGVAFADEGYFDEALLEWRKAVELAPDSPLAESAASNIEAIERMRKTYGASSED